MITVDPVLMRKAAAFVEAISKVESDFGFRLQAGEPIAFGVPEDRGLALLRAGTAADAPLALGLYTPAEAAPSPRFPIHGRD